MRAEHAPTHAYRVPPQHSRRSTVPQHSAAAQCRSKAPQQLHLYIELCVQRGEGPPKTSLGLSLTTAPAPTREQVLQCLQRGEGPPKVRVRVRVRVRV